MKVGWIGMGQIGRPMALRVLTAGHVLTGHARKRELFGDIEAAGGRVTDWPHEAVADAEIVCVNLFSETQLIDIMLDQNALAAMQPGSVLVVHSTVRPAAIRRLAAMRDDVAVVDAAFSGTARDAAEGRIALMAGGNANAIKRATPVLSAYADHIAHVGATGAGMTLKLVNNMLFAAQVSLARDALRIAAAGGIGANDAVRTIGRSSGGSYALALFAGAGEPDIFIGSLRPYLDKDVAAARAAAEGLDLGRLGEAARDWG